MMVPCVIDALLCGNGDNLNLLVFYKGLMMVVIVTAVVIVVTVADRERSSNRGRTEHLESLYLPSPVGPVKQTSSRLSAASGCSLFLHPAALVYLKV